MKTEKEITRELEDKIRNKIEKIVNHTEKKMFGGICFMVNGNMAFGAGKGFYMFRVGAEQYEKCLKEKDASEMLFTGRPLKGFIYVNPEINDDRLVFWIQKVLNFVETLPSK